jgi:hypothetical protein
VDPTGIPEVVSCPSVKSGNPISPFRSSKFSTELMEKDIADIVVPSLLPVTVKLEAKLKTEPKQVDHSVKNTT